MTDSRDRFPDRLHVGTCSWKYSSWKGLIYSRNADGNYLQEYARHFDTVEIDQWFWSLHGEDKVTLPVPGVVEEYVRAVHEKFQFSVKVPNSITLTHFYGSYTGDPLVRNPHFLSRDLFLRFLDRLKPMHPFLGPLIFQFEYLNKQKMASQSVFFEQLGPFIDACPDGFSYAIEIRNPNYINTEYFRFLQSLRLDPVFIQGYYMPQIFPLFETYGTVLGRRIIIRLIGPDRHGIEEKTRNRWNTIVTPRDNELDQLVPALCLMLAAGKEIFLNVNNHYEGSAPLSIGRIRARMTSFGDAKTPFQYTAGDIQ